MSTPPNTGTPMGGTELILANLKKALPELTSQVQIIMSRPEQVTLENKPRILWLQDLPQDPASQCLKDPVYRSQFNHIVFCSHWQQQQYAQVLGIPYSEGIVIKNGVPHRPTTFPKARPNDKLRFIYTSTPHRGLNILAAAAELLAAERQDWELHVYSSLNIYGWHDADKQFEPLYDSLRKNPCVTYHGSRPNADVRDALEQANVFVYPSIYAETSCMAIQEAMMAGCLAITTNFGALPETCGEWAWMFGFDHRPDVLVTHTLAAMKQALQAYDEPHLQSILRAQSSYYQQYYAFEARVPAWKNLLEDAIAKGVPEETVLYEA